MKTYKTRIVTHWGEEKTVIVNADTRKEAREILVKEHKAALAGTIREVLK